MYKNFESSAGVYSGRRRRGSIGRAFFAIESIQKETFVGEKHSVRQKHFLCLCLWWFVMFEGRFDRNYRILASFEWIKCGFDIDGGGASGKITALECEYR